jgi:uncharacterized protein (DUF1800 family)
MRRRKIAAAARPDALGLASIAAVLGAALILGVPGARAGKDENRTDGDAGEAASGYTLSAEIPQSSSSSQERPLTKEFKGNLPITQLSENEAILHALTRLGYGPRPGDIERVREMGLAKWIDEQLHPDSIDDSALEERLQKYPTLRMSSKQSLDEYPPPNQAAKQEGVTKAEVKQERRERVRDAEAQVGTTGDENIDKAQQALAKIQGPNRIVTELAMAKLDRAVYSKRQLEAVMEDFWFNHFNVFENKGADRWLMTAYVRDTIRPHTMGKFQDLLLATAKSPAMLFYLDNWLSADPVAFARMQQQIAMRRARYQGIFGSGAAPQPGTFPAPGQAQPANAAQPKKQDRGLNENYGREVMELHTVGVDAGYTQEDVIAMAECLTGWTVHEPRKDPEFFFDDRIHAQGRKVVMGRTFDYGGMKDGEEALKMLANHPSTAHFISLKLARHFVADNPPPAQVARMEQTYKSTGGDIRSVLKTMIYSPEFWSRDAYRSKIKTPFELVASTARALNADLEVGLPAVQWVGRMGEPLFQCQPPTGYSDKAQTWVNTGALLNRLNFALTMATDHMAGTKVSVEAVLGPGAEEDSYLTLTRALQIFLDGQVAEQTQKTLEARMKDPQVVGARLDDSVEHVNEGLVAGLVLGTPEFQRR